MESRGKCHALLPLNPLLVVVVMFSSTRWLSCCVWCHGNNCVKKSVKYCPNLPLMSPSLVSIGHFVCFMGHEALDIWPGRRQMIFIGLKLTVEMLRTEMLLPLSATYQRFLSAVSAATAFLYINLTATSHRHKPRCSLKVTYAWTKCF